MQGFDNKSKLRAITFDYFRGKDLQIHPKKLLTMHFQTFCIWLFLIFPVLLSAQNTAEIAARYDQGKDAYYDDKDYEAARDYFQQALALKKKTGIEDEQLMKIYLRLGKAERRLRLHEDAVKNFLYGKALAEKLFTEKSDQNAEFLFELGNVYSSQYLPAKAIATFEECLDIQIQLEGAENEQVADLYVTIGYSLVKMSDFENAENYYKKAFDLYHRVADPEKSKAFYRIHSYMGNLYRYQGDYGRAINYLQKALDLKIKHEDGVTPSAAVYYRNLSRAYNQNGDHEKALPLMEKAKNLTVEEFGPKHSSTAGAYGELGNIYADLVQYQMALELYEKAIAIQELSMPPTHPYVIAGIQNIATVYEDMGDYQKANENYKEALNRFRAAPYMPPQKVAETMNRMALNYLALEEPLKADVMVLSAFEQIAPGFDLEGDYQTSDWEKVINLPIMLDLLATKVQIREALYQRAGKEEPDATNFEYLDLMVKLMERLKQTYVSEETIQDLQETYQYAYEQAVELGYELVQFSQKSEYLERTFLIAEKSKAGILSKAIRNSDALEKAKIPVELQDVLSSLKSEIAGLESSLLSAKNDEIQQEWLDKKIEYEQLIRSLEETQPAYFELKYGDPELSIKDVQGKLPDSETAIVSYYLTPSDLFIFVLDEKEVEIFREPLEKASLNQMIAAYRKVNQAVLEQKALSTSEMVQPHQALYQVLISPIQNKISGYKQLVVIPHGAMYYISFESLMPSIADAEAKGLKALPFLIQTHQIQYAWSAGLWAKTGYENRETSLAFAGFAPQFGASSVSSGYRASLSSLPYAKSEIEAAAKVFEAQPFLGASAKESSFYEIAQKARILHFATHAIVDDEVPLRSGLYFETTGDSLNDGFLNALEIYNLPLIADLVVISACHTGFGPVVEGEGVMNLGRAFTYAGSESVLYSLWLANDFSSAQIFEAFYQELGAGASSSEALHQARLQYLDEADPLTAHPAYWGHLVLMGGGLYES